MLLNEVFSLCAEIQQYLLPDRTILSLLKKKNEILSDVKDGATKIITESNFLTKLGSRIIGRFTPEGFLDRVVDCIHIILTRGILARKPTA